MSLLPHTIHESWNDLLTEDFISRLNEIEQKLDSLPNQDCGYAYFPVKDKIMRFMEQDLKSLKSVILGMEPYPSWYIDASGKLLPVATGRSFEIANITSWKEKFRQSSLRNILKTIYFNETGKHKSLSEIRDEIQSGEFTISEIKDWFDVMNNAGVLFLNASLTVVPLNPNSHADIWSNIMNDIIKYIDAEASVKWLLFGAKAQNRVNDVIPDCEKYTCCHPRLAQFENENVFKNVPEIKWNS